MAIKEITPMVEIAIKNSKNFNLIILTDKEYKSQNIPLHLGNGLSSIKNIPGYDSEKHRWISGKKAYKYFFGKNRKKVRKYILYKIASLRSYRTFDK